MKYIEKISQERLAEIYEKLESIADLSLDADLDSMKTHIFNYLKLTVQDEINFVNYLIEKTFQTCQFLSTSKN